MMYFISLSRPGRSWFCLERKSSSAETIKSESPHILLLDGMRWKRRSFSFFRHGVQCKEDECLWDKDGDTIGQENTHRWDVIMTNLSRDLVRCLGRSRKLHRRSKEILESRFFHPLVRSSFEMLHQRASLRDAAKKRTACRLPT
jgi:hypothetical protein